MNTFRILGLTVLTLLSIVPLAKPLPPTLHTQLSSQPARFTLWTISVSTPSCGSVSMVTLDFYNFTENLSGRDAGSTWVKFPATNPIVNSAQITLALIYNSNNLNSTTLTSLGAAAISCRGVASGEEMRMQLHTATFYWRVMQSGNYSVFIGNAATFLNCGGCNGPPPLQAVDTWTVTTIS